MGSSTLLGIFRDDKSGLISFMSTIETFLEKGFKPKRSVILALGFDEEASGLFGAHNINKHLLANYGENGFTMLIDKGAVMQKNFGAIITAPAVSKKIFSTIDFTVSPAEFLCTIK
ncbi:hypothetical protein M422DRAFT_251548 [Sphaerobolus stellatus SS14]|uniref:Unplaced genomic scaffold SPHSTscaffold_39, whole genome shotgun sequence n=1 Tax=Sphaerobolus stellatus (strain SS14) TaxID=990650 RepID=A0A0C9VD72_SPHS4|nr:hypothetical protein M422DRAFT_251548 [Sphaerobolus stellatus SS14]